MVFGFIAAAVTVLLAAAITARLYASYRNRPRASHAMWALAFFLAAVAALMQALAYLSGHFPPGLYRVYLLTSASVPGFMGAGTVYLLWRRAADIFAWFTALVAVVGLVAAFTTPLAAPALLNVTTASADVSRAASSGLLAIVFAVQGALGGFLALVIGALYSYIRTRRPQNLAIALGGIIFAVADTLAAYGGVATFFPAEIVGMLLLFYGISQGRSAVDQAASRSESA
jgi:hypothetical protein